MIDEIKIGHVITGALAGAISLIFNVRPRTRREKVRVYSIVLVSAIITSFLTPLFLAYFKWAESAEYGISFLIGIFGMGVLEGLYKLVQKFTDNPLGVLKEVANFINHLRGK